MNNQIHLLKKQTIESHAWIEKFISQFPEDKFFDTPEFLDSNFAWQLGHLILSFNYYNVVLLVGPNEIVKETIDLKKYAEFFYKGNKKLEIKSHFQIQQLKSDWDFMCDLSIKTIGNLNEKELNKEIFKLPKEHPFVKTKEDSISWNIKHTMWHCGQIAQLKRIVDSSLDLGF
ncbi:MAG: DinB family protein [Flavobacteriia bacterium]|nr:DinB family protein [Flavobacteriia bacterium]